MIQIDRLGEKQARDRPRRLRWGCCSAIAGISSAKPTIGRRSLRASKDQRRIDRRRQKLHTTRTDPPWPQARLRGLIGRADGIIPSRLRQWGANLSECCKQGEHRRPRTTTSIPVGEPAKPPRHEPFRRQDLGGGKAIGCGHLFREGWAPVSALSVSPF